jgi:broad specificity phosphatase PhoE
MTDLVRLTLVSHAMTDAMAAGRFPADEPLSDTGCRQVKGACEREAHAIRGAARQLAGPEQRARQTAKLLGLQATTDPRLADLDCGRWRGETLERVRPEELQVWLTDPAQAPHGGESIVNLIDRVAGWLQSVESLAGDTVRTVAVTHPAVIRAAILLALDIPPKSFWRIDIAPVSRTVMHLRGQCWTLRLQ